MLDWKNNTVVCTAVTGGYDHRASSLFIDDVDYIYFTDGKSPFQIEHPWKEIILEDSHLDNRRRSKRPKLYPHSIDILNNYKYVIWIDGDMEILKEEFIPEILSYLENGFVISPHFDNRTCAYGESTIRPAKYINEPLDEQVSFYKSEGFPENYGLYECGVSARDMKNKQVEELGKLWYEQNIAWSYQDQVSLPYCLWKTGYKPDILPKSFRDYNWVRINAHKRED
jgi:hypothetical protein